MVPRRPTLIVTMGDPAGIGPEIVARALAVPSLRRTARLAVVGDPEVMARAARRARPPLRFRVMSPGMPTFTPMLRDSARRFEQ